MFEELCLKSVYNETDTDRPFDPSSSFSVAEFAVRLAWDLGLPVQEMLAIVVSQADPEEAFYRQVFRESARSPALVASLAERPASAEEVAKEFPNLRQFPADTPGPYERRMGEKIAGLLCLFRGRVPDPTSNAIVLELALTSDRWSAGHALFDILHRRMLAAMRARDWVRYLQHEFELACLRSLYNAVSHVHPFAPGSPFWVAGAALRLAKAVGAPEQTVVDVLAPPTQPLQQTGRA